MDFDDLEPGSKALFDSLFAEGDPESVRTLAIEAVRTWNRLCKLDRVISGDTDTWLSLSRNDAGDITVAIDNALTAARTQASSYRMLIEQIWRQQGGANTGAPAGGDALTLIQGFINDRGAAAAG
ncbi:hypothetical protein [Gordonia rubripertincta]|uniref:hypothetical protein n=1 Tax=Gordonia rubripertincta TaxID=36822 RepID=UPI0015FBDC3B|nr:hypothetical protein [Gordonia rubripertincta]QMU22514.1 hypothetical protein H3V45_08620 [Gordonia rubripertincta]